MKKMLTTKAIAYSKKILILEKKLNNSDITKEEQEKLIALAEIDTTKDTFDTTRQQLTDALYYLDALCENSLNNDYFRTLYNTLATIAENTAF